VAKITRNRKNKKHRNKKLKNEHTSQEKPSEKIGNKKPPVINKAKRDNIIIASFVIICMLLILYFWNPLARDDSPDNKEIDDPKNYVAIPVSSINDGELHYFETAGVKYYTHKNPWGEVITRISFCEKCSSSSFRLENDGRAVGCTGCITQWRSDSYEKIEGTSSGSGTRSCGCEESPPAKLLHEIIDNHILVKKADIKEHL
jgi:hypothetical protein